VQKVYRGHRGRRNFAPPKASKPAEMEDHGPVWEVHYDYDGMPYYHNLETGETSWDRPAEGILQGASKAPSSADTVLATDLAGGWVRYEPPDAKPYYHNPETGVTQWEAPPGVDGAHDKDASKSPDSGWQEAFDEDGTPYYYNEATQETQWDPPPGWRR
jgi:pre-mRNA-processing factor 40